MRRGRQGAEGLGRFWRGWSGNAWRGSAWFVPERKGAAGLVGLGRLDVADVAMLGAVWCGLVWWRRRGRERLGGVWSGRAGKVGLGGVGQDEAGAVR